MNIPGRRWASLRPGVYYSIAYQRDPRSSVSVHRSIYFSRYKNPLRGQNFSLLGHIIPLQGHIIPLQGAYLIHCKGISFLCRTYHSSARIIKSGFRSTWRKSLLIAVWPSWRNGKDLLTHLNYTSNLFSITRASSSPVDICFTIEGYKKGSLPP